MPRNIAITTELQRILYISHIVPRNIAIATELQQKLYLSHNVSRNIAVAMETLSLPHNTKKYCNCNGNFMLVSESNPRNIAIKRDFILTTQYQEILLLQWRLYILLSENKSRNIAIATATLS